MIKRSMMTCLSFFTWSAFACTIALPTNHPNFCSSFQTSAICFCKEESPVKAFCSSMNTIHTMMKAKYGTIANACANQRHTSQQDCIDGWNCYMNGGFDSQRRACSGLGMPCA